MTVTPIVLLTGDFSSLCCGVDGAGKMMTGAGVAGVKLISGVEIVFPIGDSSFNVFSGATSIVLVLIASDDTFNTDVVVAVLKVTDVFVDRFAVVNFGSSCPLDVLTSAAVLRSLLTLSTSSFDSSPRRKLNIISNFDL